MQGAAVLEVLESLVNASGELQRHGGELKLEQNVGTSGCLRHTNAKSGRGRSWRDIAVTRRVKYKVCRNDDG